MPSIDSISRTNLVNSVLEEHGLYRMYLLYHYLLEQQSVNMNEYLGLDPQTVESQNSTTIDVE